MPRQLSGGIYSSPNSSRRKMSEGVYSAPGEASRTGKPKEKLTNLLLAEKLALNLIDRDQDMNKGEVIVTVSTLLDKRYEDMLWDLSTIIGGARNSERSLNTLIRILNEELDRQEGTL